jgi:hypothetical protein
MELLVFRERRVQILREWAVSEDSADVALTIRVSRVNRAPSVDRPLAGGTPTLLESGFYSTSTE